MSLRQSEMHSKNEMQKNDNSIVQFESFSPFKNLIHGVSTRIHGDMRDKQNRDSFLRSLQLSPNKLIQLKQIHSDRIVKNTDTERMADGIYGDSAESVLSILTADCVPVFVYDSKTHLHGLAHAGWKGVHKEIVVKIINRLIDLGASIETLHVALGPHIHSCCYSISEERVEMFDTYKEAVERKNGTYFLDLSQVLVSQLMALGVPKTHIEVSVECTGCESSRFYSYRGDRAHFGEMMSVLSVTT